MSETLTIWEYLLCAGIVLAYILYILFALTYEAERPPSQGWEDEE